MSTIWAFDLGKGSIGEAVWNPGKKQFDHVASLLIPAEFASTKEAASRRRMMRTRQAHKAREAWLDEVWHAAGLKPLVGRRVGKVEGKWQLTRKGDEKLEREFAAKGDSICYTSCLLRIKLLRGEKLEAWQIYKALYSAIQKRGYDPNIAWKSRENRRSRNTDGDDEEKGTAERMAAFERELLAMSPENEDHRLPCYFDAWKMGLWSPMQPDELKERIDHRAESTRNRILPRHLVELEIRLLIEAAGKLVPSLAGKASYVIYGPAGKAYASYFKPERDQFKLREGGSTDWQGVLGQKIPRFDNRIIEKCVLMPRFNVCKVRSDEQKAHGERGTLPQEVTFLMKLKNMRVQRTPTLQNGLTAQEIMQVFEAFCDKGWKLTETQWRKFCVSIGSVPVPPSLQVEAPKMAGRSRFSRPALEVLKRLVISGQTPQHFHASEIQRLKGNIDPQKGLIEKDLKFLLDMGTTWEGIYVPNQKLDALAQRTRDSDAAILELIGSQNDPIVRHRLGAFCKRLQSLEERFGDPQEIVIEFIREDFMGEKALLDYRKFIKDREKDRKQARLDAEASGSTERSAGLKMELLRLQGGVCLYTEASLIPTHLDEYEIDHIVPRSQGGPDSMVNYILTTKAANDEKANRTPFEWLSASDGWDAYVNRVKSKQTALRNKKVRLLLLPEAAELAEKMTALAETAWIAKLAQTLAGLHFGWQNGNDNQGNKRVTVISGGLTARIRRKYKLNSLLAGEDATEEEAEKKNRDDDRHHALDAMVLAFIPGWARNENKQKWFRFPDGVTRENTFKHWMANTLPYYEYLEKPKLAETIYGKRRNGLESIVVQRADLMKLAYKQINPSKTVYDLKYAKDQFKSVRDPMIKRLLLEWCDRGESEEAWKRFAASLRVPMRDGNAGPLVRRVLMNVGEVDEYIDMSKDGYGALRKAKKSHRGQIVYFLRTLTKAGKTNETVKVCPVYVFQSDAQAKKKLLQEHGTSITIYGFFQSGCMVTTEAEVAHEKMPLPAGQYLLNTIRTGGDVKLTRQDGKTYPDIPRYSLSALIKAGFKRAD
jgi:CRISPR-associated endonuclease Csn1